MLFRVFVFLFRRLFRRSSLLLLFFPLFFTSFINGERTQCTVTNDEYLFAKAIYVCTDTDEMFGYYIRDFTGNR